VRSLSPFTRVTGATWLFPGGHVRYSGEPAPRWRWIAATLPAAAALWWLWLWVALAFARAGLRPTPARVVPIMQRLALGYAAGVGLAVAMSPTRGAMAHNGNPWNLARREGNDA
jgi:hypothetical protein